MGYGRGKGQASGSGSGSACGLGFVCSLVCGIASWLGFLTCVVCMFIPMWQTGQNYHPDEKNYPIFYQGLFVCCKKDFSSQNYACYQCKELYTIPKWQMRSTVLYALATAGMLVCAVGSILMVCDCCRGCCLSTLCTLVSVASFLLVMAALIIFGVGQGTDNLNLDVGYGLAVISAITSLVSAITFFQAICTTAC